ncbi:hypothetical protein PQX77_007433, partial [Marasmius sp. AFHP31]
FILATIGLAAPTATNVFTTGVRIGAANSIAIAVFNGLLAILTGGRIWWITREARRNFGPPVRAQYKAIIAAVLESGMLYSVFLIISIIVPLTVDPDANGIVPVDLIPVATLMSGLAPTLIIVRVTHGKSVESVQQVVSLQFARRGSRSASGSGPSALQTTMDIPSHSHDDYREAHPEGERIELKTNKSQRMV